MTNRTKSMAEPLLALTGVTKRFGALVALADASLDIMPGEVHCILGENGAGKSTLCNLIFGVHVPDAGAMRFRGETYRPSGPSDALSNGIAMVHQHFSLVHDMTVVDNVILGQQRGFVHTKAWAQRLEKLANDYGFALDPYAKIDDLSVGERQRVEIVKCLIREPRLFVLDEPTAVLLPDEITALLDVCRRVAAGGCAVVLVTHKLAEIKKAADRVTVLRGGRVVAHSDHPAEEIDALVRAMIQGDVKSLDKSAASMLGVAESGGSARVAPSETPPREAVQIDALTVTDGQGVTRLDKFTLAIGPGEIVGVAGVEGNGQSELAAVLSGMATPTSGRVFLGELETTHLSPKEITAAGVGVVPEDRHAVGCVVEMSVAENIFLNRLEAFTSYGFLRRKELVRRRARTDDALRRARRGAGGAVLGAVRRQPAEGGAGARDHAAETVVPPRGAADPRPRCRRGGGRLRPYPRGVRARRRGAPDFLRARRTDRGRRPHRRPLSRPHRRQLRRRSARARAHRRDDGGADSMSALP